eukprot:3802998-Pyramimonas_sp.AAC.1
MQELSHLAAERGGFASGAATSDRPVTNEQRGGQVPPLQQLVAHMCSSRSGAGTIPGDRESEPTTTMTLAKL